MREHASHIPAPRTKRLLAYVIDQSILGLLLFVLGFLFVTTQQSTIADISKPYQTLRSEKFQTQDAYVARYKAISTSEAVQTPLRQLFLPLAVYLAMFITLQAGYYIYYTTKNGATLGKRAMKLQVISTTTYEFPTLLQSTKRYFLFIGFASFSILFLIADLIAYHNHTALGSQFLILYRALGYATFILFWTNIFMVLFRTDRRGLHDVVAKTIVVQRTLQSHLKRQVI